MGQVSPTVRSLTRKAPLSTVTPTKRSSVGMQRRRRSTESNPAAVVAASSPTTIQDLPDEVLVLIFREVRAAEQLQYSPHLDHVEPSRRDFGRTSGSTSWTLATVSRIFNGPATQVLYEHVAMHQYNIRQFLHTIIASPAHGALVRSLKVRDFSESSDNPIYKPSVCYDLSPRTVENNIKSFAEKHQLSELLDTTIVQKRLVPNSDVEQLLVALASPNVKHMDIEIRHPGTVHNPVRDELLPQHVYCGLTLEGPSRFGQNLTSLTLRSPCGYRTVHLSAVAAVFSLKGLQVLTLQQFESAGPHDNGQAFKPHHKSCNCITSLNLLECNLNQNDLRACIKACSALSDLTWRCNEQRAWQLGGYDGGCIQAAEVVEAFEPCAARLKTFTFDHLEEVKDWSGVHRRMNHNYLWPGDTRLRGTQAQYLGPVNFDKFVHLDTMEVTAHAVLGVQKESDQDLDMAKHIPANLQRLCLRMPQDPFPPKIYNKVPGTRHWKMLAKMCEELNELDLGLPLRHVEVKIPNCWPELAPSTARKLGVAVSSVHRVRLILRGPSCWKLDSEDPAPPREKRPRRKTVQVRNEDDSSD